MFQLFSKKTFQLNKPIEGSIVDLEQVPDPMFAQKMIGDGFAINPSQGSVYAPVNGLLHFISPQGHAYGIKSPDGAEVMIHIGIDSALLKGEGFHPKIEEGVEVQAGDLLLTFDLDFMKERVPSILTPIIITNSDDFILSTIHQDAKVNECVLEYQKK